MMIRDRVVAAIRSLIVAALAAGVPRRVLVNVLQSLAAELMLEDDNVS